MDRPEKQEMAGDQGDGRGGVSVVVKGQRWLSGEALAGSPQHDGDSELHRKALGPLSRRRRCAARGSKININDKVSTAQSLYPVACFVFKPSLARRIS